MRLGLTLSDERPLERSLGTSGPSEPAPVPHRTSSRRDHGTLAALRFADTRASAHAAFLERIGLRSQGLSNEELAAAVMDCGHERVAEFVDFLLTHLAYVQVGPIPTAPYRPSRR